MLYTKAYLSLRQGVELEGKPLPVIKAPHPKKKGVVPLTGSSVGKPKSRGGFFKPKLFLGPGKIDLR
jgi:hypothetical protein